MSSPGPRRGHYLGTEIDEKWWRRYSADGFLARGLGELSIDGSGLVFRRYLIRTPVAISFTDVFEVKVGTWHAGRWAGGAPIVKVVWQAGERLSSGFVVSRDAGETESLVREIRSHIRRSPRP